MNNIQQKAHAECVAVLFEDFCADGRAHYNERPATEWESRTENLRHDLDRQFDGRHVKGEHVDKATLIARYHAIHLMERFPQGIPENFLTPVKVRGIVKRIERNGEFA